MRIFRILLLIILFTLMNYWAIHAYTHAKAYESATASIAKASDAAALAQGKIDQLTSVISFGWIKDKRKEELNQLKTQQQQERKEANRYLYYFLGTLGATLLIALGCSTIGATLILATDALISLIFGLINPILMVTIHKEIEHLGDVILSFESKGIVGSISKLWESGEHVVGMTILLFSVVIPLLKISTLILTLLFKEFKFAHRGVALFKHLGKWSMLDVFVVAIFLVYLTSNQGEVSRAEIQIGLYFFLTYVILSMITTIMTQKVISPSSHHHDLKTP